MGKTKTSVVVMALVLAWVWLPALRPVFKYYGHPVDAALALLIVLGVVMWELRSGLARRWVEKINPLVWKYASWGIAVGLMAASAVVYPIADGLKARGGGSDADDAMMLGGAAILQGMNPYLLTTYLGNPFSPGPGWLALLAPLGILYPLLTGLSLLAVAVMMVKHGMVKEANTFAVLMAGCVLVWEMAVTGNDLVGWGLLMVLLMLVPVRKWQVAVLAGVMLGCLATARIAFLYVPVVYAFAHGSGMGWNKWLRGCHVLVGAVALASAVAWHVVFWLMSDGAYAPMHLLGRAQGYAHGWVVGLGMLILIGAAGWMLKNWRRAQPELHMAIGFGAPMFVLALMDLASVGKLGGWEGATYMMPALPLVLLAYTKTKEVR